jgi:hypothetical protein
LGRGGVYLKLPLESATLAIPLVQKVG